MDRNVALHSGDGAEPLPGKQLDSTIRMGTPGATALERLPTQSASAIRLAVLERLRRAITIQEMPAGTRLGQAQLAERLGVSRMPVRDAISDLVAEGLAQSLPGGGAVVTALTLEDMRAVYEIRSSLEIEAVRVVAGMSGESRTSELDQIIERHRPLLKAGGQEQLLDLDRDFHWSIYRATGNRFLQMALTPIWSQISRIMFTVLQIPSYDEVAWREHVAIADCIHAGDVDGAVEMTRQHLTNSSERLLSHFQ